MSNLPIRFLFVFLFFVVASSSCGGLGGGITQRTKRYPSEVSEPMQQEFNAANRAYASRQFDTAYNLFLTFTQKYPYNSLADESYYKLGKILFLRNQFTESAENFRRLAKLSPDPAYVAKGYTMSAYAEYRNKSCDRAFSDLRRVKPDSLDTKLRVQFYSIAILCSKKFEIQNDLASESILRLFELYEDSAGGLQNLSAPDIVTFEQSKNYLESWITEEMSGFPAWMRSYPRNATGRGYIEYKIGKFYYESGNLGKAARTLTAFTERFPKNPYVRQAQGLLDKMGTDIVNQSEGGTHVNIKVGLLLPLSGSMSSYGQAVLDGVRCAAGKASQCDEDTGIEIIALDSGETTESMNVAIGSLVSQKVNAIIGPMSSQLAVPAAVLAGTHHIPLFPITQMSDLMRQSSYVFQVGLTAEQQIRDLVSAARARGLKRFVILMPNVTYGQRMAQLFSEMVVERGGEIVAKASYNKSALDIAAEAKNLKTVLPETGIEKSFDAIFIPDSHQSVNALSQGLSAIGISGMPLIGTNAWNDPGFDLSIAEKFPGSFFVDIYNTNSGSDLNRRFRENYTKSFGHEPTILSALGYDALRLIHNAAVKKSAAEIYDVLSAQVGKQGLTGLRGFQQNEAPIVETRILKITPNGLDD